MTIQSIIAVKLSKQKFQFIIRLSATIQLDKLIKYTSPFISTLQNKYQDKKKEHAVNPVVIKQTPDWPKNLPKNPPEKKPNKGNKIIVKSILLSLQDFLLHRKLQIQSLYDNLMSLFFSSA